MPGQGQASSFSARADEERRIGLCKFDGEVAHPAIATQRFDRAWVHGHLARLGELGSRNGEHPVFQVDVGVVQRHRFGDTKADAGEHDIQLDRRLGKDGLDGVGEPFSPSTQAMKTSCTPRLNSSVTTCHQNWAPSLWASQRPSTSFSPSIVMPMARFLLVVTPDSSAVSCQKSVYIKFCTPSLGGALSRICQYFQYVLNV